MSYHYPYNGPSGAESQYQYYDQHYQGTLNPPVSNYTTHSQTLPDLNTYVPYNGFSDPQTQYGYQANYESQGTINPQQLYINPPTQQHSPHYPQQSPASSQPPSAAYPVSHYPPSPERTLEYAPRKPEHTVKPNLSIVFTVRGVPGVNLNVAKKGRVSIDHANEQVQAFVDSQWRRTGWVIDLPDYEPRGQRIWTESLTTGQMLTYRELLSEISYEILKALNKARAHLEEDGVRVRPASRHVHGPAKWELRNLDVDRLMIVGMNYYGSQWVPILALEMYGN